MKTGCFRKGHQGNESIHAGSMAETMHCQHMSQTSPTHAKNISNQPRAHIPTTRQPINTPTDFTSTTYTPTDCIYCAPTDCAPTDCTSKDYTPTDSTHTNYTPIDYTESDYTLTVRHTNHQAQPPVRPHCRHMAANEPQRP